MFEKSSATARSDFWPKVKTKADKHHYRQNLIRYYEMIVNIIRILANYSGRMIIAHQVYHLMSIQGGPKFSDKFVLMF